MQKINEFLTFAEIYKNKLVFDYTPALVSLTRRYYKLKLKSKRLQVKYVKKFIIMCLIDYMDKYKQ